MAAKAAVTASPQEIFDYLRRLFACRWPSRPLLLLMFISITADNFCRRCFSYTTLSGRRVHFRALLYSLYIAAAGLYITD